MTRTPNSMIPGVVDGTVTPTLDAEGNLSLHIVVRNGRGRTGADDYIEVVLTGSDARELLSVPGRVTFPCSVGVRLQSDPSRTSSLQESSCR